MELGFSQEGSSRGYFKRVEKFSEGIPIPSPSLQLRLQLQLPAIHVPRRAPNSPGAWIFGEIKTFSSVGAG